MPNWNWGGIILTLVVFLLGVGIVLAQLQIVNPLTGTPVTVLGAIVHWISEGIKGILQAIGSVLSGLVSCGRVL